MPLPRPLCAAALLLLALLPSCYTTVGKCTDLRSETNRSWIAWGYVPLSPGGWMHFDRPEATGHDDFTPDYRADPCVDLARAIADELEREKLVEQAEFSTDGEPDAEHTHVLRGKLRAFYVHESRWTYLVSVYAWIFWALGAPVGRSENGFCADLELVDLRDGKVAWSGSIVDADHHVEGLYYGPEWYRFSWMRELRLREKMPEIAAALGAAAAPLPPDMAAELAAEPPGLPSCLGIDSGSECSVR